ncbi:hypothetical protein ACTXG7_20995 [Mycolicibacterium sp. Dal123E01]|uniref:hypothetical protein n=1 Tax=Mycolicibacterium sp. Dal123E01 TaxID=3457578 RepID=UPI00403EA596
MTDPTEETTEAYEAPSSHRPSGPARSSMGWIAPVALVVALIAAGLGGWALLRPAPKAADPAAAPQQPGDPKTNACTAWRTVSSAILLQTHADPGAEVQGVAANARLAMSGGATYLFNHLNPGVPADIADPIRSFATGLQDISINALAGVPNSDPAQAERLRNAEATNIKLAELCK